MEESTIHSIVTNLRKPSDYTVKIRFTPRSIKFITRLFSGILIDEIEFQSYMLTLARSVGCFADSTKTIQLPILTFYLINYPLPSVPLTKVQNIASEFDIARDSVDGEVALMHKILQDIISDN